MSRPTLPLQNWAGNLTYNAKRLYRPKTMEELQTIVQETNQFRVLGSRHSFNVIADCDDTLISLEDFCLESHHDAIEIDMDQHQVTVRGAVTYGQLCHTLHEAGWAVHNMASLPHISVIGSCSTATHGSGSHNGNLATAVQSLELVRPDNGQVVSLSRDDKDKNDDFWGAVVALGALGPVTQMTLSIEPSYRMRQVVYENLPWSRLEQGFEAIMSSAYSVSLFTQWQPQQDSVQQVWLKKKLVNDKNQDKNNHNDDGDNDKEEDVDAMFFGAIPATNPCHPIPGLSGDICTKQFHIVGPWHERLPHFQLDFVPSHGDELQSEYFVPRQYAIPAIAAIRQLLYDCATIAHLWYEWLMISEIRTIAADEYWLSPCYQQDSVAFHFTWRQHNNTNHHDHHHDHHHHNGGTMKTTTTLEEQLLPQLEAVLIPFGVRPHWGKLFTLSPSYVQAMCPRLDDFRQLAHRYDPHGKCRNDFVHRYLFSTIDNNNNVE